MYIGGDPEPVTLTSAQQAAIDKAIKSTPKGISAKDAQALKDVKDGKK